MIVIWKNMTPHTINETITGTEIPPSGEVARVATVNEPSGSRGGVPVFRTTYGEVEGLPEPQDSVIYIVSGMVLAAVKDRPDVVAPGELVRDEDGKPVGCKGFKVN